METIYSIVIKSLWNICVYLDTHTHIIHTNTYTHICFSVKRNIAFLMRSSKKTLIPRFVEATPCKEHIQQNGFVLCDGYFQGTIHSLYVVGWGRKDTEIFTNVSLHVGKRSTGLLEDAYPLTKSNGKERSKYVSKHQSCPLCLLAVPLRRPKLQASGILLYIMVLPRFLYHAAIIGHLLLGIRHCVQ